MVYHRHIAHTSTLHFVKEVDIRFLFKVELYGLIMIHAFQASGGKAENPKRNAVTRYERYI